MDIGTGAQIAMFYVPFLFALCFHEFSHGYVAKLRGDNTAEQLGRLTISPLAHADMIGTVLLPLVGAYFMITNPGGFLPMFGWAKPVPVNPRNLKNIRNDMFWIALAGPMSNVLLALVGTAILYFGIQYNLFASYTMAVVQLMVSFIGTNLALAFFNMLPLHPLDGGKVLARFLPASLNYKLEQNEHITSYILLGLVITGSLSILFIPMRFVFNYLLSLTGVV